MLLKDKVVIVSGVGPGLGVKLCRIAAAEGAAVAAAARSAGFVRELVEELQRAGHRVIGVPTDATDDAQCTRLAQATAEAFGRIDGLINSTPAHNPPNTLEDADVAAWLQIMDVNCYAAVRMARAVLPAMKQQHDGAIVNVGSISSVKPSPGEPDYAVAKAALGGLTRQMAGEFARYNVRVNHARLGMLWGPPIQGFFQRMAAAQGCTEQSLIDDFTRQIPLGVIPPDDECAKSVLFFVSDLARMVTGATLDINGGWYMP